VGLLPKKIMTNLFSYQVIPPENGRQVPIKAFVNGVPFEDHAKRQLENVATLPFIYRHIAAMPDIHAGRGCTVGAVVPTKSAIIPACVGVDIGCGMMALQTSLSAKDLPDNLEKLRANIEAAIPVGRTDNGGKNDRGAWGDIPENVSIAWMGMEAKYRKLIEKNPKISHHRPANQLCSLGTGNHFIELCLDENQNLWFMLHSGSRGPGNSIGGYFIELAKKDMQKYFINMPDQDLAYLPEHTEHFDDYIKALNWAQDYAKINRELMMENLCRVVKQNLRKFEITDHAINCHHNYVARENHYGENVFITRKGAVRAREGDLGIIPGSMGTKSYIVRGKGNADSFHSCSHGAGRKMSRTQARATFTLKDHRASTEGVECRKDRDVIDETPGAYKDIDAVMVAQTDLVDIVHTLKQILCVKG
jgi:tRNA-splicing ligase RtcB (3'-phosphate/5'-hydroxy nucleic acid ligase)